MKTYEYYIDLDERGSFLADVRDENGETVFEIRAGAELTEEETSIFEDGFMKHHNDIEGRRQFNFWITLTRHIIKSIRQTLAGL